MRQRDQRAAGGQQLLHRDEAGLGAAAGDDDARLGVDLDAEARRDVAGDLLAQRQDAGAVGVVGLAARQGGVGGVAHGLRHVDVGATCRRVAGLGRQRLELGDAGGQGNDEVHQIPWTDLYFSSCSGV